MCRLFGHIHAMVGDLETRHSGTGHGVRQSLAGTAFWRRNGATRAVAAPPWPATAPPPPPPSPSPPLPHQTLPELLLERPSWVAHGNYDCEQPVRLMSQL
jgi:hypothetical protein